VNCWVAPTTMEGPTGITAIETSTGAATESVVDPMTELDIAEIVVVPAVKAFARPPLDTPAISGDDDVHVDADVTSFVLPSL